MALQQETEPSGNTTLTRNNESLLNLSGYEEEDNDEEPANLVGLSSPSFVPISNDRRRVKKERFLADHAKSVDNSHSWLSNRRKSNSSASAHTSTTTTAKDHKATAVELIPLCAQGPAIAALLDLGSSDPYANDPSLLHHPSHSHYQHQHPNNRLSTRASTNSIASRRANNRYKSSDGEEEEDENSARKWEDTVMGLMTLIRLPAWIQAKVHHLVQFPYLMQEMMLMQGWVSELTRVLMELPSLRDDGLLCEYARRALSISMARLMHASLHPPPTTTTTTPRTTSPINNISPSSLALYLLFLPTQHNSLDPFLLPPPLSTPVTIIVVIVIIME
eukprot:TRINITY_DN20202_c0_g1_i1.p1 TRINITY_DN20202_c0_g1~~TRINITY_DN20202_c0_g1_i1.p1  ORF type:complete len:333 (+),score=85.72 TRINITY_DN20202_c0_g1_i1:104-1102(+)